MLTKIGLVAAGSALGGVARWALTVGAARLLGTTFPWGTFVINLAGSFFLGWFLTLLSERLPTDGWGWVRPDDLRLLVAVGFTGAFTTFSTYEYESHNLLRDGNSLTGTTYLFGSVLLGLLAVRLGILLAGGGRP
jgi:CrcB protein